MKKTISILIASTILILSVFSVNAFAAKPKTDALLDKLETATEVSVTIRSGETLLFCQNLQSSRHLPQNTTGPQWRH